MLGFRIYCLSTTQDSIKELKTKRRWLLVQIGRYADAIIKAGPNSWCQDFRK
jgi:hypothetical protein